MARVWILTHLAEGLERGVTNHAVTISGLDSNTIYYFQLESGQTRGTRAEGEAESADVLSFRTVAAGQSVHNEQPQVAENARQAGNVEGGRVKITNGPVIEAGDSNHLRIAWTTNIPGSTRVTYGPDVNNLTSLAERLGDREATPICIASEHKERSGSNLPAVFSGQVQKFHRRARSAPANTAHDSFSECGVPSKISCFSKARMRAVPPGGGADNSVTEAKPGADQELSALMAQQRDLSVLLRAREMNLRGK